MNPAAGSCVGPPASTPCRMTHASRTSCPDITSERDVSEKLTKVGGVSRHSDPCVCLGRRSNCACDPNSRRDFSG